MLLCYLQSHINNPTPDFSGVKGAVGLSQSLRDVKHPPLFYPPYGGSKKSTTYIRCGPPFPFPVGKRRCNTPKSTTYIRCGPPIQSNKVGLESAGVPSPWTGKPLFDPEVHKVHYVVWALQSNLGWTA